MLRANNVKSGRVYKKWHNRALLIDIRKIRLVIEDADSENVPSNMDQNQLNFAVPGSQVMVVENFAEEPQEGRTGFGWLSQTFSSVYDILA